MVSIESAAKRGDGRLWVIALGLSLLFNSGILVWFGLAALQSEIFRKTHPLQATTPPAEQVIKIFPEIATANPVQPTPAVPVKPEFARTSPDQAAPKPEKPAFIGERDTQATSDHAPTANAPVMPSQSGIEPKNPQDFETTQSNYRDGSLTAGGATSSAAIASTAPAPIITDPAVAQEKTAGTKTESPGTDDTKSSPPVHEKLFVGPNPFDMPVPTETSQSESVQPTPPKTPKAGDNSGQTTDSPKPKPQPAFQDPAFSGFQRKTAITGSISRTGKSALAVADSPLGRYQAIISRAVELEWQRNCVRHRDFITPGFLTVRFFVETSGRVRTVQFVGDMETGEVQKGFTLNSIRDAAIPAMPPALKKDYDKEPLELIFNFYF
jgi:hypothetical protein